jgi:hypothetical protein
MEELINISSIHCSQQKIVSEGYGDPVYMLLENLQPFRKDRT